MKIRFLPLILLCLLLGGCSRAVAGGHLISAAEGSEEYCTVLNTFLPGYIPREPEDTLYAEVSRGNAVACFDVQAVPAMRRGVGRYWYPHVLGTVVLAVDRSRTDAAVTGWNSLRGIKVPVGMGSGQVIRNMLALGAIAYGLDREEPSKQAALAFLEQLNRDGGFELDYSDAPILICLDYEAAAWNRSGENYEMIVPEEGTLSFCLGLLSDSPLDLEPGLDEALLDRLKAEPYYSLPLPKSTGRELFGAQYAEGIFDWGREHGLGWDDLAATATELTAWSIADAYERYVLPKYKAAELLVGGGGSYNKTLLSRLSARFERFGVEVKTQEDLGFSSDAKEAVAFALLGDRCLAGLPNSLPAVTGAANAAIMGKISLPPR